MNTSELSKKDQIARIIRDEAGKLTKKEKGHDIHVAPYIEPWIAENAVSRFGAGAKQEDVLLVVSTAIFKGGAKGLFLSDNGVYRSSELGDSAAHIDYESITQVDFSTSETKPILYVNQEQFAVGLEPVAVKLLADILVAIQRYLAYDALPKRIQGRLQTIKALKDENLLSEEEYQEIRSALIDQLKSA